MVMFICAEAEPPLLFAQIVNVLSVINEVGVPLIAPVEVLNAKPLGRDGLISHDVMVPPLTLGVLVVIVVPFSRVMFSGE